MFKFNICPRKPTNNLPLKYYSFGTIKLVTNAIKSNFIYNAQKKHLIDKVHGVFVMTLLEML